MIIAGLLALAAYDLIGDYCLISVHGKILRKGLLLSSATKLVEPLGQDRDCSRGLVSLREIFRVRFKIIGWIASPRSTVQ
jgi:hypothetical protein